MLQKQLGVDVVLCFDGELGMLHYRTQQGCIYAAWSLIDAYFPTERQQTQCRWRCPVLGSCRASSTEANYSNACTSIAVRAHQRHQHP